MILNITLGPFLLMQGNSGDKEQYGGGGFLAMGPEARGHGVEHSPLGTRAHLAMPP